MARSKKGHRFLQSLCAERDGGWWCRYCGLRLISLEYYRKNDFIIPSQHSMATLDHVVPRSQGGMKVMSNFVLACGTCNRRKADGPAPEMIPVENAPKDLLCKNHPSFSAAIRMSKRWLREIELDDAFL